MKTHIPLFSIVLPIILIACGPGTNAPAPAKGKPTVAAVNYPLAFFAERIGGELIEVHFPKIEGDPAFWNPTAAEVRQLQSADLILLNGATYAKWRAQVSLPESKTVNTSAAFTRPFIETKSSAAHQHGKGSDHSHAGTAFTTWLDFKQATQQAAAVHSALATLLPMHREVLAKNFAALQRDLAGLDSDLRSISADLGDTLLLGSHPVYQYLARGYGLKIRSVHWEPDAMPDAAGWAELEALRKTHPAKLMLWEDEPENSIVAELNNRGIRSVVFAPCGNRPGSGDWLKVMRANGVALRKVLAAE